MIDVISDLLELAYHSDTIKADLLTNELIACLRKEKVQATNALREIVDRVGHLNQAYCENVIHPLIKDNQSLIDGLIQRQSSLQWRSRR